MDTNVTMSNEPVGATIARQILRLDDVKRSDVIHNMLLDRTLSRQVHELNGLMLQPQYKDLGAKALKAMGFEI